MSSRLALMAFVVLGASGALADDMKTPMNGTDIKWGPAPPFFPKGAEFAVLSGDPSKDGLYVVRLKMPAGYKIPAHNSPDNGERDGRIRQFSHRDGRQPGREEGN